MAQPFFRPFRRLQWKLTFSYIVITVTTLVVLMLAGFIAGSEAAAANFAQLAIGALKVHAAELIPYLSATPPDRAGITQWLQQPEHLTAQVVLSTVPHATYTVTMDGPTVVVDQQGMVVASHGAGAASVGTLLEQQLPPQATTVLRAALGGQTEARRLAVSLANGMIIVAYPLFGPYGRIAGALVAQATGVSQPAFLFHALLAALLLTLLWRS